MDPSGKNFNKNQFFEDMTRMASGAVGALSGFREHMEQEMRSYAARFAREMDFVPREEFEIVEAMAKKAREENEALKKRIEALEKQQGPVSKKVTNTKAKPKKKTTAANSAGKARKKSTGAASTKKNKAKKGKSNATK